MRELHPTPRSLEVDDLHAGLTLAAGEGRAWVAIGMVTSLDGAAALDGDTAALGGEADRAVFGRLRAAADAILVGAGTVRDESYGPPRGTPARRADRVARGLAEVPRLVIVTGSLDLAPDHRVFSDPAAPPLVATHAAAPADRAAALAQAAEVVRLGQEDIDLAAVLRDLYDRGLRRVLCEGGPSLNAALLAADLVDEAFVTVAPVAIGGDAPRIAVGPPPGRARPFTLVSVHEHDGELLLRYRRAR